MRITNYNELFQLFDRIIELTSDEGLFLCKNSTIAFNSVFDSFNRCISFSSDYSEQRSLLISYSGLLAASCLGLSSLISCSDKKKSRRYQLSFEKVFPLISSYVSKPYNYFVYNLYPNSDKVFLSRDLFGDDVNLFISYHHKVFIVHHFNEYDDSAPFITLLSPSIMFIRETSSFDFID